MSDHCQILWVIRHNRCLDLGNGSNKFGYHCSWRSTLLLKVYFGSIIRFSHFIIMVGGTPSLASPDGTSLIFYYSEFWATWACPEKRVCPEIFHCIEIFFYLSGFLSNLCLPWKTECLNSLYWIHIFFSEFWTTCACPEKQSLPWNFLLYWIYFLQSGFLSNLRLPWKTECALNSLYWIYTFYHSEFWTICACPENRVCPKIFHCIEIFFISQDFSATCACPENNRVCPESFRCIERHCLWTTTHH